MSIDWLNIVAILGAIGTFIGLALTVMYSHRADRRKILVFDVAPPLQLASILPDRTEHRLSIVYESEGAPSINVKGACLRFIQLGNLGKEPIRLNDIAPGDPLRVEVMDAKVLDMAISGVSRDVINFRLAPFQELPDGATTGLISFDFLDSLDGAVIRVLTDSVTARIRVLGTIIGMPQGIVGMNDFGTNRFLNGIGCGLAILLQLSAVVGGLFIFYSVTGGWSLLWIFLLPFGVLFLPAIMVAVVSSTIWPKGPQWPRALGIPDWFVSTYAMREDIYRHRELDALIAARDAQLGRGERRTRGVNDDGE